MPRPRTSAPPTRSLLTACAVAASLATPALADAAPKTPKAKAPAALTSSVRGLGKQVAGLPGKSSAQKAVKLRLTRSARSISTQIKTGHLCSARTASKGIRKTVKSSGRKITPKTRAALTGAALKVETNLLVLPGTARCGGVTNAPAAGTAPVTKVLSSTPSEMTVSVALPAVQLDPKTGGGKTFTQATMPGLSTTGVTGGPAVPTMGQSFAIPSGASVSIDGQASSSYTLSDVDLYPAQQSAVDQATPPAGLGPHDKTFADKPFTQDAAAYKSGTPFPAQAATAAAIPQGELRDLQLGQLDLAGAQYTPRTKTLKVFTSVTATIHFNGGSHTFGDAQTGSVYNAAFQKVYGNVLANGDTVLANLAKFDRVKLTCGEEMLVVTSPALRAAADTFAAARNARGILTKVVQTGGDVGTTADQIRNYVQDAVASSTCIRPSYLTLLGNTANVPTFHGNDPGQDDIPTDFLYAEKYKGLPLPNLAVGRIPAQTLGEANTMVSKIVGYENAPTSDSAYYQNATVTSYFQGAGPVDERGFLHSAERLRDGMIANGKTVQRLMAKDAGANPKKYDDGTLIPSGLSFTATHTDVVNAVNAGRFLLVSRDHGSWDSISEPNWGKTDVPSMTNAAKPTVAWLIACSTGYFDVPGGPSLAETLLSRDGGGAAGVIAASRVSPSEVNNRLLAGLSDAVWPNILPYDGSNTPIRRMGDVLNSGKLHVILDAASLQDFYGSYSPTQDIRNEQRLYNYFGDPSMQLYTSKPANALWTGSFSGTVAHLSGLGGSLAGAAATLLENGVPVGKAFVAGDGSVDIDPNAPVGPGKLEAVIDGDGYAPSTITVRDEVAPTTPVVTTPAATTPAPTTPVATTPAAPKADLVVTAVSSREAGNGTVPIPANIVITVKNQGTVATKNFIASVNGFSTQTGQNATVSFRFADGLQPGESQTRSVTQQTLYNALVGTADTENQVDESDETNNTLSGQGPNYKP